VFVVVGVSKTAPIESCKRWLLNRNKAETKLELHPTVKTKLELYPTAETKLGIA